MKNDNSKTIIRFNTTVVHSKSKNAWNVVNQIIGAKYKIAKVPYVCGSNEEMNEMLRNEALQIALFISECMNNKELNFRNVRN